MLALGLLGPVTRTLAGTYRCTAANIQGKAVKEVTLTVECEWGAQVHLYQLLSVQRWLPSREGQEQGLRDAFR